MKLLKSIVSRSRSAFFKKKQKQKTFPKSYCLNTFTETVFPKCSFDR